MEKTPEELANEVKSLNEKANAELSKAIEDKASTEEVSSLKASYEEKAKNLEETINKHDVALNKLISSEKEASEKSFDLGKVLSSNAEGLKKMKTDRHERMTFKVPGTMLNSTNILGGNVPVEQRLPGFDIIARRRVRLFDIVSRGSAESNIISWVSEVNPDPVDQNGVPTAEGDTKAQKDFDLQVNSEALKKITCFIKISTEMLEDVTFIQSEINRRLVEGILRAAEAQIYEGDGTGANLNGIVTVATAFAPGAPFTASVDNANIVDVLRAAATQIKKAEQDGPNYILLNPCDVGFLMMQKVGSSDDRYIDQLQLVAGNLSLDGIPIVETTLVAQDEYLIGDFSKAFVYDKGSVGIDVGYENDDFTKNLVTVLGEIRLLSLVQDNDRSAFIAGDFTTDKGVIETP